MRERRRGRRGAGSDTQTGETKPPPTGSSLGHQDILAAGSTFRLVPAGTQPALASVCCFASLGHRPPPRGISAHVRGKSH